MEVQRLVQPAESISSLPKFERWADGTLLEAIMEYARLGRVGLEAWKIVHTGQTYSELAKSLTKNIRGIVGNQWTDAEKKR